VKDLTPLRIACQGVSLMCLRNRATITHQRRVSCKIIPSASFFCLTYNFLSHLTKSLAVEWAEKGVRVNCISPGYTMTPLVDPGKALWPDWISKTPAGRMGRVEDLQGALVFLASEVSLFLPLSGVCLICYSYFRPQTS